MNDPHRTPSGLPSPSQPDRPPSRGPVRFVTLLRGALSVLFFCFGAGLLLISFPICQSDERFFAGAIFCVAGLIVIGLGVVVMPKKKGRR
jgi:hypothetical protein